MSLNLNFLSTVETRWIATCSQKCNQVFLSRDWRKHFNIGPRVKNWFFLHLSLPIFFQSISQRNNSPRTGQPSISITPLPGRGTPSGSRPNPSPQQSQQAALKPGQPTSQSKSGFVICEICDGYIKDLEQLRNHMQWIHKVSFTLFRLNVKYCQRLEYLTTLRKLLENVHIMFHIN